MDYKKFFTTDNKSGWKTKEDRLKRNHPDIWLKVMEYREDGVGLSDLPFKEVVWHLINDVHERNTCGCGNRLTFQQDITKGYNKSCSMTCWYGKKLRVEKSKKTSLNKYGVEYYAQTEEYKERVKKTNLEKYGVEYQIGSKQTRNKIGQTFRQRYGVDTPLLLPNVREKVKVTNSKRYGVDNVFACEEIKGKISETNRQKYGVEYYMQTEECKERVKKSNLEKYGVDNVSKLESIKKLITAKMLGREIKEESIKRMIETKFGMPYEEYELFRSEYSKYKTKVIKLTNQQNVSTLENFCKRGKTGLDGAYHLDHKYSIFGGFKNNVSPEVIGDIHNLEFIPWKENVIKGSKCKISLDELLRNE